MLFGDDLIGKTVIDLDDREYCPEWKKMQKKPIEQRELYHPSTSMKQGLLNCFVQIMDQAEVAEPANRKWDIAPEPIVSYQMRLCVLDTKNVPVDEEENMTDTFIVCRMGSGKKLETDTHWRCQTGEASFNWRMLFDVKAP